VQLQQKILVPETKENFPYRRQRSVAVSDVKFKRKKRALPRGVKRVSVLGALNQQGQHIDIKKQKKPVQTSTRSNWLALCVVCGVWCVCVCIGCFCFSFSDSAV
jgi:hypothetical protein